MRTLYLLALVKAPLSVRVLCCFWLTLTLMLSFSASATSDDIVPTTVRYCIPQNNVYPFFITEKGQLTGINPDMMSQVFNDSVLPEAKLEYVRRPWKRCNIDLDAGDVEMIVGGYDKTRTTVIFPNQLGFTLKESVISTAEVCFFSMPGAQMQRARNGLEGNGTFIVGIEAGFSKQTSKKIKPQWLELFNPIEKYRMLEIGRVDAIIQVCGMDGNRIRTVAERFGFTDFEMLYPPYLINSAYAIFSNKFADAHPDLAKRIIELSTKVDKEKVYNKYRSTK